MVIHVHPWDILDLQLGCPRCASCTMYVLCMYYVCTMYVCTWHVLDMYVHARWSTFLGSRTTRFPCSRDLLHSAPSPLLWLHYCTLSPLIYRRSAPLGVGCYSKRREEVSEVGKSLTYSLINRYELWFVRNRTYLFTLDTLKSRLRILSTVSGGSASRWSAIKQTKSIPLFRTLRCPCKVVNNTVQEG